jgi:hypothetical protein
MPNICAVESPYGLRETKSFVTATATVEAALASPGRVKQADADSTSIIAIFSRALPATVFDADLRFMSVLPIAFLLVFASSVDIEANQAFGTWQAKLFTHVAST